MKKCYVRTKKGLLLLLLLIAVPLITFAQTIRVTGKITDSGGESLPGVNIVILGTTQGTITDIDGVYSMDVPSDARLTFNFIGFNSQTIEVNNQSIINVVMTDDVQALDEVVVVGYGQMKRSDLTGAVVSISSDAITKSVATSIDQVLQGRAAGVQVQQNSGMPGASTSIRIRGISSLSASSEPIYVIDGVIISGGATSSDNTNTNALASINPADIVSMDILKDASATAIYGSRGSNGVIIITTKKGQKGEAVINYNGYIGWQQIPTKLDVLNLQQYATHRNTLADLGLINYDSNFVRPDLLGEGTDWQDELFKIAVMQNHNLSISGGNEKSTYSLSAGYSDQDGIAEGSGFERMNLSGSFDSQVKSYLKAGVNFAFSNTKQDLTVSDQSLVITAIRTTPNVPVRNPDGSFAASDQQFMPTNPMALATLIDNRKESAGIRANTYMEFTPDRVQGLSFRTALSFDYNFTNTYRFQPTYYLSETQFRDDNEGAYSKRYSKFWSWRNILTYDRTFEMHKVTAMLGHEMQKSSWEYLSGSRTGYPTNGATDLGLGDVTTAANDGYTGSNALLSGFGRIFYSYADKYLLTTTLRYDESSKFAKGNRGGWFPSAALAWKVSNEDFLKDNSVINNLKLRLGWGLVGNQNIPDYAWLAAYTTSTTNWGTGLIASNTPNEDLTWESTSSSNIGFNLNLFGNRIELITDVYYKKTKNLLLQASLPAFVGTSGQGSSSRPWVNLGSLENKGIEFTLNTVNVDKGKFLWRSNFVFTLNRNKVLSINTQTGEDTRSIDNSSWGSTGSTIINRSIVGEPIGQFYGYQVIGRFEKATDFYYKDESGNVKSVPVLNGLSIDEQNGVWIGDYIYKDQNHDDVIDEKDRAFIGNPEPKFTFGIGNTFIYGNFDLTVFLTGSYGNDVINYARRYMENPRRNISNLFESAIGYAQTGLIDSDGPNDYRNVQIVGGDPKMSRLPQSTATSDYDFAFSDRFVEDGSYLRIQNISLGYTFPKKWTSRAGISNLKIYGNLQNVYTFTKYSGFDPEVGISYSGGNQLNGVDNGRYPSPRIYTVGINVSF
ncbi:MAG: SusC/RagA family TonB-linked outer membrane protein [Bacteroidales bacterium]|nr:MAG: SusC/RagA family TonB-linked outer membrane protein [Bacteroidales bacterium]